MRVLLLGATASVGLHILQLGVEQGHEITVLVRNPEKLKSWENRARIIKGDALDEGAVDQAVRGQDASIYSMDVKTLGRTTLFSESTGILIEAMERNSVKRLVCITRRWSGRNQGARRIPLRPDFVSARHEAPYTAYNEAL